MMFSLSAEEIEVLKLSCQVAATCLALSLIPALAVGWVLARKEFFGKSLFETFIFLPLVLPPVVPDICCYRFLEETEYWVSILSPLDSILHLIGKAQFWLQP